MNYFITAIGTDCGKTIFSAILCEALHADYWKPVQAGLPRDAEVVKGLLTNTVSKIHPETYLLNTPASPHAAAKQDSIEINMENFAIPKTKNNLIIEGAGGCLVPLNDRDFVIDLVKRFDSEIILVSNLYLGSINHTLLSAAYLKNQNYKVTGIVFNGKSNPESETIILRHTRLPCILRIEQEPMIDQEIVRRYAKQLKINLVNEPS